MSELRKKNHEDVSQYLYDLWDETKIMSQTIDDFLNVTKIEAGLFTISPKLSDPAVFLHEQIRLIEPQPTKKMITIETDIESELQPIKIDPKVFNLALDNLLSNAIKYTDVGGLIKIGLTKKGRNLVVRVEDNGVGVPEREKSKIFEKMFRASNIAKSEGTGLGLYIVKILVEQSGGKIWLAHKEPGTVFYLTFPLSGMKKKIIKNFS